MRRKSTVDTFFANAVQSSAAMGSIGCSEALTNARRRDLKRRTSFRERMTSMDEQASPVCQNGTPADQSSAHLDVERDCG